MSETRTLKVVVVGNSAQAQAALKELGVASETAGAKAGNSFGTLGRKLEKIGGKVRSVGSTMTHMFTLPIVAAGAESVHLATQFNAAMTRIQTQAGASAKDVRILSAAVLKMAPDSQHGPVELANALYHLKSVGMDNADAMKGLKASTDLANVSGADLEDTTNALAGTWRSTIKGAKDFGGAIGTINAIVGAGNMRMTDLNGAIGTGFLATAKTMGVSLRSVGAAMAVMTDNSVPATQAGTRLRMTMSMIGAPSKTATKVMDKMGISAKTLSTRLSHGGLVGALGYLQDKMKGMGHFQQKDFLTQAFGGSRSAGTMMMLLNNFDLLKRKQEIIAKGAGRMGSEISKQAKTPEAVFHTFLGTLETVGVKIGNQLLPYVLKAVTGIEHLITKFQGLNPTVQKFVGIGMLVLAALGPILVIVGSLITVVGALMTPVGAWIAGMVLVGLALVALYKHSAQFRQIVSDAFHKIAGAIGPIVALVKGQLLPAFAQWVPILRPIGKILLTIFGGAVLGIIDGIVNVIEGVVKVLAGLLNFLHGVFTGNWSQAWKGLKQIVSGALQLIWGAIEIWWNADILGIFKDGFKFLFDLVKGGWRKIASGWKGGISSIKSLAGKVIDFILAPFKRAFAVTKGVVKDGASVLSRDFRAGVDHIEQIGQRIIEVVTFPYRMAFKAAVAIVKDGWNIVRANFTAGIGIVKHILSGLPGAIKSVFSGALSWLIDAGKNVVLGLISGIKSQVGALLGVASGLGDKVKGAFSKAMHILSPSRVMMRLGRFVTLGVAHGIADPQAVRELVKKVNAIADAIVKAFKEHKISKGKEDSLLGYLKSKEKAWGEAIKRVDRTTTRLNAAKARLTAAQQSLGNIRSNKANLISSTSSTAKDYAGLMGVLGDGTSGNQNDPSSILTRLKGRLANIKAFRKNITTLAKDGLSNDLLNQILAAGPDTGAQMAAALLGDTSVIGALNSTEKSINRESNALGLQAGNRTYNGAIRAAQQVIQEDHRQYVDIHLEVKHEVKDEKELAARILKLVRDGLHRDDHRNGRNKKKK